MRTFRRDGNMMISICRKDAALRWPLVVLVIIGLLLALVYYHLFAGWTPEKVEKLVAAGPPPGSNPTEVEAWLQERRIQYWYLEDVTRNRLGRQTMPEIAGLEARDLSGMVKATISDANGHPLLSGNINIYFFFDKNGKLVKHLVLPFVDYP
jgi:hypothetical protein